MEALLAAAFQLLAERGDPRARGGAFLRLAIRRLGTASAQLHGQQPGRLHRPGYTECVELLQLHAQMVAQCKR